MRSFVLFILLVCVVAPKGLAQKLSVTRQQVWTGYFNQTRFTQRSGIWLDLQMRLHDFVDQKSLSIARLGYTYFVSDQFRLTAGYGLITHYALLPGIPDAPENRLWQQVQWFEQKKRVSLSQYFRVEERFVRRISNGELADESIFSWRFRYNFAVTIPLKGERVAAGVPFIFLNDELHVNAGKNIVNNYFDQNRAFAGVGYQFTSSLNAQIGYLYVFQQLASGNQYIHTNAIRLFVFHNLNFRK